MSNTNEIMQQTVVATATKGKAKVIKHAELIKMRFDVTRKTLVRNKKYESEDIIGEEFWADVPDLHTSIGRDIAYMAKHKLLPITFADKNSRNWNEYWID